MPLSVFVGASSGRLIVGATFAVAIAAVQCKDEKTVLERGESCGSFPAPDLPCAEGLQCIGTLPGTNKDGDARCVLVVTVRPGEACDDFPVDKTTLHRCPPDLTCRGDPVDKQVKCLPPTDGGS